MYYLHENHELSECCVLFKGIYSRANPTRDSSETKRFYEFGDILECRNGTRPNKMLKVVKNLYFVTLVQSRQNKGAGAT